MKRTDLRLEYQRETGKEWCISAVPTGEYCNWIEDRLIKLCNLHDVGNQSELLIAFYYHMDEWRHDDNGADFDDEIENWIKSNL